MQQLFVLVLICLLVSQVKTQDDVSDADSLDFTTTQAEYQTSTMTTTKSTKMDLHVGLMGFISGGPPFQLYRLGSAGPMAARDINADPDILPNHTMILHITFEGGCYDKPALNDIVTLVRDVNVCTCIM